MNSGLTTLDPRTGQSETNISLSGFWSESYDQIWKETISNMPWHPKIKDLVLRNSASPVTAVPNYFFGDIRHDASTVSWGFKGVIGKPVSRAGALQISRQIIERAERERIQLADGEAKRGIQWEEDE